MKIPVTTKTTADVKVYIEPEETPTLDDKVTPNGKGKLDMVIADCKDEELNDVCDSYTKEIDKADE